MVRLTFLSLFALALQGCLSIGPGLIRHDRAAISNAIGESWKDLTLLNIVKIRYSDMPVFLDVSSVISSNSMESGANFEANLVPNAADDYAAGVAGKYTDRPTITYTPLLGEKFSRNMMRPISPSAIFSLVQGGYPVDLILQLTVRAINGVYNRSSSPGRARKADPKFYEMLDAMRRLQRSELLGMRLERRGSEEVAVIFFSSTLPEAARNDSQLVHEILGIRPDLRELSLTFGAIPRNDSELAVLSRSMIEILVEFAAEAEVPADDVKEGRAPPSPDSPANPAPRDTPLLRIHSSRLPFHDSLVSVKYRDHWFWIDDRDFLSKRTFIFTLMLFSLAESGAAPQIPVVTVPVN